MTALQIISVGKRLMNVYDKITLPVCKKYGINRTGFDVLMFCANNPENNTARDICAIRGIKSGIASVAVDSLIKDGLMSRREDPNDRRINRLVPTEKAMPIIKEGRRVQKCFSDRLRTDVSEEEMKNFMMFIDKLIKNIEAFEQE